MKHPPFRHESCTDVPYLPDPPCRCAIKRYFDKIRPIAKSELLGIGAISNCENRITGCGKQPAVGRQWGMPL
jgi:hypothetical protein